MNRIRILYARHEYGKDALGRIETQGMAIYSSSKQFLGYIPRHKWRVEKERYIHVRKFNGKAFVKLMPMLKNQ